MGGAAVWVEWAGGLDSSSGASGTAGNCRHCNTSNLHPCGPSSRWAWPAPRSRWAWRHYNGTGSTWLNHRASHLVALIPERDPPGWVANATSNTFPVVLVVHLRYHNACADLQAGHYRRTHEPGFRDDQVRVGHHIWYLPVGLMPLLPSLQLLVQLLLLTLNRSHHVRKAQSRVCPCHCLLVLQ